MANKTIYVKDEVLWEKAKKFAGDGALSAFVSEALQDHIDKKEREMNLNSGEMTTAELPVGGPMHGDGFPHHIAFKGRLLYDTDIEADPRCMVFETQAKRLLLYKTSAPDNGQGATYEVFSGYTDLAKSTDARNNFWLHGGLGHREQEGIRTIASKLNTEPVVWID